MNDVTLRKRIAQIAADSSRVIVSPHAKKQMVRRKVSRAQVDRVLRVGYVVEHAHCNIKGNWQCTLQALIAGEEIRVAAALWADPNGEWIVVITVMN